MSNDHPISGVGLLELCDLCGDVVPIRLIRLEESGQFLCPKCSDQWTGEVSMPLRP